MNSLQKEMLNTLKDLRDHHGVLAIKAEFEAEGSRTDELVMLNELVFRADMKLYIKIGGCEAVRDLDQCRLLGASGIMAPMVETPFAMHKFVCAAKTVYKNEMDTIEWIINAETKTCRQNFDEILSTGKDFLKTISIGRVDLSGSMGLTRSSINSEEVFEAAVDLAARSRNAGMTVNFGGGISFEAIPFILKFAPYADRFETRKVVFRIKDNEKELRAAILTAMKFEIMYLQNKCNFYDRMANEDKARVIMLQERYEKANAEMGK